MTTDKHDLFAVLGTADDDGIVAHILPDLGSAPLVTLSRRLVDPYFVRLAQHVADQTGRTLEVVRYTRAEVLTTIRPRPRG